MLLLVFATPDPGPIYSGYLGLVLYGMSALAVGILTSTLTSNQIIAAVVGTGISSGAVRDLVSLGDVVTGVWATVFNHLGLHQSL